MTDTPLIGNPQATDPIPTPAVPGTELSPQPPQPVVVNPAAPPVPAGPDLVDFYGPDGRTYKIERSLLNMLSQPPAAPPPPQQPQADPRARLREAWYTNPDEAVQIIRDDVTEAIRQEYRAEQAKNAFWQGFRSTNPDLARVPDYVVDSVVARNAHQLRGLPDAEGFRRLGDMIKTELFTMGLGQGQNTQQPPVLSEGQFAQPLTAAPAAQQPQAPQAPKTLGTIINDMRTKRRAGFSPPQSSGA